MMTFRRERPRCRKKLLFLMQEYHCSTLQELLDLEFLNLSKGLRIQAHKMIAEGCFVSAKVLLDNEQKNKVHYWNLEVSE